LQIDPFETGTALSQPPIMVARPKPGQTFQQGQSIFMAVDTTNSLNRTVEKVIFYANDLLLGEDGRPMYRWRWADAPVGQHTLRAQVVYTNGASTLSSGVEIEVVE